MLIKNLLFLSNIFYIYFHQNKYIIKINIIFRFSVFSLLPFLSFPLCDIQANPKNALPVDLLLPPLLPLPSTTNPKSQTTLALSPHPLDLLLPPLLPLPPLSFLLPPPLPLPPLNLLTWISLFLLRLPFHLRQT